MDKLQSRVIGLKHAMKDWRYQKSIRKHDHGMTTIPDRWLEEIDNIVKELEEENAKLRGYKYEV